MKLYEGLLEKSIESFKMAIEIYNKPMIKYRVEGFAYYMCNAWELMLKSHMIRQNGKLSIYYPDNPERTLSYENCIQKVFTNNKDPLRLNLEKILELKTTSPSFIVPEYEYVYIPLFQSCVFNYMDKIKIFHGIEITDFIPSMFLTLPSHTKKFSEEHITEHYPYEIAKRILDTKKKIDLITEYTNVKFAIRLADFESIHHAKKEIKSAYDAQAYKITAKLCILSIRNSLKKSNIQLLYDGNPAEFNNFHLNNFMKHFGMKNNSKYCYIQNKDKQPQYTYSQAAVEFIFEELSKDPEHILTIIKK